MLPKQLRLLVVGLVPLIASCNLLTPLVFIGDHKKKVSPEFDKLAGSRVAILVWTAPATLFDYPFARFELATYIADKLDVEMVRRDLSIEVVDTRDVEDFVQKNIDAQIDPQRVGRAFDVDYVVYLEILKFQVRDPKQPQFLRGEIHASVTVHDVRSDPDQLRRYELTPIRCVHPEKGPVLMTAINSPLIREETYRKFAEMAARKFYEHTVELL